jgi:hypothetical protein
MAWVETTARRHETVLETIAAQATVVPMRMCTVYATRDGVRALLRREADALHDALALLVGKSEWSVKVFHDPDAAGDPPPAGPRGVSGADYIQRRLRERAERAGHAREIDDAVARIHDRLCAVTVDAVIASPQRRETSGRQADMVLNGVYLVPEEARDCFDAETQALALEFMSHGLQLEVTGPWPAYNFVPGTIGAAW